MENNEYLRKCAEKIAEAKLQENVSTVSIWKEKQSGFLCEIIKVEATGESKSIKMVAKVSTRNDKIRAIVPIDEVYKNELLFYEEIYPQMQALQEEIKTHNLFNSIPKFFGRMEYEDQSYLFMEDLTDSGFKTFDIKDELDHDHIKLICEVLGKFHALSFTFKHHKPEMYNSFGECLQSLEFGFKRHKGGVFKRCAMAIQEGLKNSNCSHKLVDHYVDNFEDVHKNIWLSSQKEEYSCLLHYDGWPNNFMFKYDITNGTRTVEDVKLLDWQTCRVGPPALDLSIALYTTASRAVLNNLEEYLRIYYKSFEIFLCQANLKAEDVYPFDVLKEQWKTYFQYGLLRAFLVYKLKMNIDHVEGSFKEAMEAKIDVVEMQKLLNDLYEHFETLGVF